MAGGDGLTLAGKKWRDSRGGIFLPVCQEKIFTKSAGCDKLIYNIINLI